MTCRLGSSVLSSFHLFPFSDPYLGQRYCMTSCLFKLLLQSGSKNTSAYSTRRSRDSTEAQTVHNAGSTVTFSRSIEATWNQSLCIV